MQMRMDIDYFAIRYTIHDVLLLKVTLNTNNPYVMTYEYIALDYKNEKV